jgi:4-alpha-glucanotransferase
MLEQRASGILLHPSSLAGPRGIGDLGNEAFLFVDFLAGAGQSVWQILPLGPAGHGHSPYSALSAFAGHALLISLEQLVATGDLDGGDLAGSAPDEDQVRFDAVAAFKKPLLGKAARQFRERGVPERRHAFERFCREQAVWLEDYVLFRALRRQFDHHPWYTWPEELRDRRPAALEHWRRQLDDALFCHRYEQFVFFEQWLALRVHANRRGVRILGDLPIFVALDSSDVWARPELFHLDEHRQPTVVAGVPPDYFSATGQRWGNPLYRWEKHEQEDFAWWRQRIAWNLTQCDLLRIDHFRGFAACWTIPAGEKTAVNGQWRPVPGEALFAALHRAQGALPLIAEDLGVITPDVVQLRDRLGLPGMKILQFAFDSGPTNPYLPHNLAPHCVIYTGTHDNDTTRGWWNTLDGATRAAVAAYLGRADPVMPQDLIRLAWASVARLAICPLQDLLGLGSEARMNLPGRPEANWSWRLPPGALTEQLRQDLAEMTRLYGRWPKA